MLKAVIFDMDGVIIDSEPMHAKAAVMAMKKYNIDIPIEYAYKFIGTKMSYMCSRMVEDFNMTISPEELTAANNEMKRLLLENEGYPAIPYVIELIRDLYDHELQLIIASSSGSAAIEYVMDSFNIRRYFSGYISGDMVTRPKPAPDIFLQAAERFGLAPSECLVIEDSYNGVTAARAAGMACIGFYNPNSGQQDLSRADFIVEGFDEVDYNFINQVYCTKFKEPAIILTTKNFIIRELSDDDIDELCLLRSEPEIRKYLTDTEENPDIEKEKLKAYIKNVYSYYGFGLWGVFSKKSGRLVGQCGIEYKIQGGKAIYELGYMLSKAWQGKGYAFEFTSAVINYCFTKLSIDKITAVIDKDNNGSIRLAQRLGMKRVSECIRCSKSCYIYEISRQ